jgi:cyclopropane-fatty-acyl-phospholipid synthase
MLQSMGRVGNLQLRHLEELGPHYVRTLQLWARAFHERLPEVRSLGFDEAFVRTWDYYLAVSEAAFREGHVGNAQLLLTRPSLSGS